MVMEVVKVKVERNEVKNNREGADVVGELSAKNTRVMAKRIMSGRVEVRKGV